MTVPRILVIAGSDSGGGAGIQADIKTITMLGGHAMTAITAVTAQNTVGVIGVHLIPVEMILAQIDAVTADIGIDAIKIGMIGSATAAVAVAERIEQVRVPVIFDPVMIATSGAALADSETIAAFQRLMQVALIVTPNIPELAALGGEAAVLAHGCHLVAKGGHGEGDMIVDRLVGPAGEIARVEARRIETSETHGTGCTLASALACGLGEGRPMPEAFERAVHFVRLALLNAPGVGKGSGPLGQQFVRDFQRLGSVRDELAPGR